MTNGPEQPQPGVIPWAEGGRPRSVFSASLFLLFAVFILDHGYYYSIIVIYHYLFRVC